MLSRNLYNCGLLGVPRVTAIWNVSWMVPLTNNGTVMGADELLSLLSAYTLPRSEIMSTASKFSIFFACMFADRRKSKSVNYVLRTNREFTYWQRLFAHAIWRRLNERRCDWRAITGEGRRHFPAPFADQRDQLSRCINTRRWFYLQPEQLWLRTWPYVATGSDRMLKTGNCLAIF